MKFIKIAYAALSVFLVSGCYRLTEPRNSLESKGKTCVPTMKRPVISSEFESDKANKMLSGIEIYGFWCGGGHYPKNPDGRMNRNHPAKDKLDAACKEHDLSYEDNCDHWCPCDKDLLGKVQRVAYVAIADTKNIELR